MAAALLNPRALLFPALLFAAGGLALGETGYIHAKARLAQWLIAGAWERTLAGERHVRPWPWADTWPVARLGFSGKSLYVLAGASGRTLAFGPALYDGSAPPGRGVTIMAGHRDTHFSALRDLKSGAKMWLEDETGKRFRYQVAGRHIVDTRTQELVVDPGANALLLSTCWPFDALRAGGPMRYVVEAVPVPGSGAVSGAVATAPAVNR